MRRVTKKPNFRAVLRKQRTMRLKLGLSVNLSGLTLRRVFWGHLTTLTNGTFHTQPFSKEVLVIILY